MKYNTCRGKPGNVYHGDLANVYSFDKLNTKLQYGKPPGKVIETIDEDTDKLKWDFERGDGTL